MVNFSALPSAVLVRALVVFILLALRLPAADQAPAWQSARAVAVATAAVPYNFSEVTATAVDATGNVFLAGYFSNTVVLGNNMLISRGAYDAFVAKFDPISNQFVWAQRIGGIADEVVAALVVSGTDVYVSGSFTSPTADCGPITLSNVVNNNSADVFVAKLTDAGRTSSFAWAQRAGGTGTERIGGLAVSGTSLYLAGDFGSPSASFGSTTLTNAGTNSSDLFVTKITDAGSTSSFVWAQRAGGTGVDVGSALAVSGTSMYLAGNFSSPSVSFGSTTLTNAGLYGDIFVTKLTDAGSTGSFIWAQRAGGTRDEITSALAVNGSNVYVAGRFQSSTASFGTNFLSNVGANSSADVFVTKLTDAGSTGSFIWAQRAGGTSIDEGAALAVSGNSVYVAGDFYGASASFGSNTLTNISGRADIFVTKLIDAGSTSSFVWAERAGGQESDFAYTLLISGSNLYVAGSFESPTAGFGPLNTFNANSDAVGFLASLTDPTLTATAPGRAPNPAQLFPNPARHAATLRLPAGIASSPLTLTDAQGRTVRRYPAPPSPEATLDLRGLPAGLYLLRGAGPAQRLAVE